jgi:translation initiation factor 1A
MPKSTKGGKNVKKGKKREGDGAPRDLKENFKEDGQEYAMVTRMLGDGRVALECFDNIARVGLIRGTMRRRVWINMGDIVLVGLREFEEDKADVIHKYSADEARCLQAYGEIPSTARINQPADPTGGGKDGAGADGMEFSFADI